MVNDLAATEVKGGDGGHVLIGEGKVPNGEILCHALPVRGLGDDYHAALRVPAQRHLRGGLAILFSDLCQHRVGEDAVPALRQRAPRLRLHAESLHVLNSPALREEGVQFHLIDHGRDAPR